jgi:S-adenosylmethionine-dependent methyltransferase
MSGSVPFFDRFEVGIEPWLSGLGMVRDAVRQELVRRQIASHLSELSMPLRVLDAGCGQGTQAIALARLGHEVVGIDLSDALLGEARNAAASEPDEVQQRLTFRFGDLFALGDEQPEGYDLVCCHGVAMYLPSLEDAVRALAGATRRGGLISLLTRNRAGLAMRAGMTAKWAETIGAFDARTYDNRLGIETVRADEPEEVQATLDGVGATTVAWYGVRLFTDHWGQKPPDRDFPAILAAEEEAGRRDPFRSVAALTHTIARLGEDRRGG